MVPDAPLPTLLLAALVLTPSIPGALGQDTLSTEELETRLDELQRRSQQAVDRYEAGDRDQALDHARHVREAFTFAEGNASVLERTINDVSAVTIGEQVKAQASRLASAIDAGDPVEEVQQSQTELEPLLNRLVLVSKGEHAPASQRQLTTEESIHEAAQEVRDLVDEAVTLYTEDQPEAAQKSAEDAFFAFEQNGLGPDTTVVDEGLENEVEHDIKNFQGEAGEPGLADLIEHGAPVGEVEDQAQTVHDGLDQIVTLLEATKPPSDLGDANQDGDVTIVDALLTAQASLGIQAEDPTMDANQDDAVTIVDALLISQAALGIRDL
ncbi:hypothetical protein BRD56_10000 [Thermoplasmatales archaeon SW_10_69_26]|nr:MAG: hypothetical protein BRD56_10000 [Thermoplasmatales archaeon SW_10_69_26]